MKLKIGILSLLFLVLSACSKKEPITMLTFNTFHEGTKSVDGFEEIKNVILQLSPDIIGFTEVRNYEGDWTYKMQVALLKEGLSYHRGYVGGDIALLSKYPISKGVLTGKGSIANFELVLANTSIAVAVAHLDYTQYACYLPRGYYGGNPNWDMISDANGNLNPITDLDSILAYNLASQRDEQLKDYFNTIKNVEMPTFLMGDFNEPSHLDWQKNTKDLFDHQGLIINWQNSKMLYANNFVDAYRNKYPNVVKNPGFTWPSPHSKEGSTSWAPKADERDRIDFIYYKGKGISVEKAAIVGSKMYYVNNALTSKAAAEDVFLATETPWPSDHKAVFSSFQIK